MKHANYTNAKKVIPTKVFTVFSILTPEPHSKPVYISTTTMSVQKRIQDLVNAAKNPKVTRQYAQKLSVWIRMMIEQGQTCGFRIDGQFESNAEALELQQKLMDANDELLMTRTIARYRLKQVVIEENS